MRTAVVTMVSVVAAWPSAGVRAGDYAPDEGVPFTVRPDGTAQELSFDADGGGQFPQRYTRLLNLPDTARKLDDNRDRREALADIDARRRADPSALSPADAAGLATQLARVGKSDAAVNLLLPRTRDRVPDFRVLATAAHLHAARGEWADAARLHGYAVLDAGFPADLPNTGPEQRKWLERVEKVWYARWLGVHRRRAEAKAPPAGETVFPLFDVRFVNDRGEYEPGALAAAERAKLPPDAVAVVQQLLLWSPWDTGLYWLLGELYAATGRLRQADRIFDQIAWSRQYSNRAEFMAHRAAVRAAAEKLPPEAVADAPLALPSPAASDPAADDVLPSRGKAVAVGAGFAVLALALVALQLRAVVRRLRGDCGPVG